MYSEKVMEHFRNPRNVGDMEDADVVFRVGDRECGDMLLLFLKIRDEVVTDVKYRIFGCGAAIATSSVASEMAMGRTLEEVLMLTDRDVADALDGLPEDKMHCSLLSVTALHSAVMRYLAANGQFEREGVSEEQASFASVSS